MHSISGMSHSLCTGMTESVGFASFGQTYFGEPVPDSA